ncbi:hypothetical protein I7I48_03042 [Histoplasma ohiense]|nr:hypothetical protein I7I48_03042 [Histoplasma ohiense (nom. inval.)]
MSLSREEIASEILAKKLSQNQTFIKSTESTLHPVPTMQRSYCPLKISLPHLSSGRWGGGDVGKRCDSRILWHSLYRKYTSLHWWAISTYIFISSEGID